MQETGKRRREGKVRCGLPRELLKHVGFGSQARVEAVWVPKNLMPQQEVINKDLSVISNMGGAIAISMPPRNKLEKSADKKRAMGYEYHTRQLKSCLGQLE